jgi:hypothetical protein
MDGFVQGLGGSKQSGGAFRLILGFEKPSQCSQAVNNTPRTPKMLE